MKLPVYSDGVGRELIFPGANLTRIQAMKYGEKHMRADLRKAGFKTHIFQSDLEIHGSLYFRITYGK